MLFYPCVENPRTGRVNQRCVDRAMTKDAAESYLKRKHWGQWLRLEAIPQPTTTHTLPSRRPADN